MVTPALPCRYDVAEVLVCKRVLPSLALVAVVAGAAVACGSSTASSLTAPTNVGSITGLILSVNPPGVGATATAIATVSLSTGSNVAISTGFTSDTPSVATVTSAGVVTGVSIGDVTISVDYLGFKATKKIRILPFYNGVFFGSYTIDTCTETAGFADDPTQALLPCSAYAARGALQIGFSNAQSADLTSITGLFAFGNVTGPGAGSVSPAGVMSYTGSLTAGARTLTLQNFNITSPSPGHIAGTFKAVWTDAVLTGSQVWTCTMSDAVYQIGTINVASSSAGARALDVLAPFRSPRLQ